MPNYMFVCLLFGFCPRNNIPRLQVVKIALAIGTGGHVDMEGVEFIKCTAFRLEPITKGSFNDLDGEVVESGPIQAQVLPGAIDVFCNI